MTFSRAAAYLRSIIRGEIREKEPLSRHTSFGIGGPVTLMVFPETPQEVAVACETAAQYGFRIEVIGHGTNLLAPDDGLEALVIKTTRMDWFECENEKIRVGAGVPLAKVLRYAMDAQIVGAEFMAGIPGTVGGAVAMNAGTRDASMQSVVRGVAVLDLAAPSRVYDVGASEAGFRYRGSTLLDSRLAILEAQLVLGDDEDPEVRERVEQTLARRKRSQPIGLRSAGSVFKNPPQAAAGYLIEQVGLKGTRRGGAGFSSVHANFIVNYGGASARDVMHLIHEARQRVNERFGVVLETEIKILVE